MKDFLFYFFLFTNILLVLYAAKLSFSSIKSFFGSLLWFILPGRDLGSFFSRKLYDYDAEREDKFVYFLIYAVAFSLGNQLIRRTILYFIIEN